MCISRAYQSFAAAHGDRVRTSRGRSAGWMGAVWLLLMGERGGRQGGGRVRNYVGASARTPLLSLRRCPSLRVGSSSSKSRQHGRRPGHRRGCREGGGRRREGCGAARCSAVDDAGGASGKTAPWKYGERGEERKRPRESQGEAAVLPLSTAARPLHAPSSLLVLWLFTASVRVKRNALEDPKAGGGRRPVRVRQ